MNIHQSHGKPMWFLRPVVAPKHLTDFSLYFGPFPYITQVKSLVWIIVEENNTLWTGHFPEVFIIWPANSACVSTVNDNHIARHFRMGFAVGRKCYGWITPCYIEPAWECCPDVFRHFSWIAVRAYVKAINLSLGVCLEPKECAVPGIEASLTNRTNERGFDETIHGDELFNVLCRVTFFHFGDMFHGGKKAFVCVLKFRREQLFFISSFHPQIFARLYRVWNEMKQFGPVMSMLMIPITHVSWNPVLSFLQ